MIGPPKVYRTLADVEVVHQMVLAGQADREALIRHYRGLKANSESYFFDRVLAEGEEPDGAEPEYLVLTDEDGTRRQHRLQTDPNSAMAFIGLTVDDIDARITELEAL